MTVITKTKIPQSLNWKTKLDVQQKMFYNKLIRMYFADFGYTGCPLLSEEDALQEVVNFNIQVAIFKRKSPEKRAAEAAERNKQFVISYTKMIISN